jgi:hypothetical protein
MPSGMTMLVKAVIACEATAEELSSEIRLSELLPFLGDVGMPSPGTMALVGSEGDAEGLLSVR